MGYHIERSIDGVKWANVGFTNGMGNSMETVNYSFDNYLGDLTSNIVYYRLKQIDFNGAFEYSPTRSIRMDAITATTSVYPNPSNGTLYLQFNGCPDLNESANVTVTDLSGRIVFNQIYQLNSGNIQLPINLQNLENGCYFLKATSPSVSINRQFVKN
jgi:hypothetical protein